MTPQVQLPSPRSEYNLRRRWLGTQTYWCCQCVGWGGVFVLLSSPLPFKAHATAGEVAGFGIFVASGLLLSHFIRVVAITLLGRSFTWAGLLLRLLPPVLVLTVAHVALQVLVARTILRHPTTLMNSRLEQDPLIFSFVDTFSLSGGLFIIWAGAYLGLRIYRHYQAVRLERLQLAADVQEAAWQVLRAQLNPHLLFNSLNSIRALIPKEHTAPRDAVIHLSELLRTSLSLKENELVPLRQELQTVDSFLALERLRFEHRLRVQRSIAPEATDWLVPPFLVQILVENAVKFGVAPYEAGGEISLRIAGERDALVIEVTNCGQLGQVVSPTSTGLGLTNLRSRLGLLFGPAASLSVQNVGPNAVCARAVIPHPRPLPPSTPAMPI